MELTDLFAGRGFDLAAMQERLSSVAAGLGLPISPRSRTCNSRKAQELGKFAEKLGLLEAYQHHVYRAYFVEGKNIALPSELLQIAAQAGLPLEESAAVLEEGTFAKETDDDWRRVRLLGISGVPAFLSAGRLLVGFRPYHDLEGLLEPL